MQAIETCISELYLGTALLLFTLCILVVVHCIAPSPPCSPCAFVAFLQTVYFPLQYRDTQIKSAGYSNFPLGVYVGVNGCAL